MPSSQPAQFNLVVAAHASMIEHGFHPDFPAGTDTQLAAIEADPENPVIPGIQDMTRPAVVFNRQRYLQRSRPD